MIEKNILTKNKKYGRITKWQEEKKKQITSTKKVFKLLKSCRIIRK